MVRGMVVAMADHDGLTMVLWRYCVSFRRRVVVLSAVIVDAAGGAADQFVITVKGTAIA